MDSVCGTGGRKRTVRPPEVQVLTSLRTSPTLRRTVREAIGSGPLPCGVVQLSRTPRPLPKMIINPAVKDIFAFTYEDFKVEGYDPYPAIKAQVAV